MMPSINAEVPPGQTRSRAFFRAVGSFAERGTKRVDWRANGTIAREADGDLSSSKLMQQLGAQQQGREFSA